MNEHIVRSYDKEINELRQIVSRMGGLAEMQLCNAMKALKENDTALAEQVCIQDKELDQMEMDAEKTTIILFARRAPVANDLREVVATLKITTLLERMGDYAKNIARRAKAISNMKPVVIPSTIEKMQEEAVHMVRDVMNAYVRRSAEDAILVWESDDTLDNLHNAAYRQILELMAEAPEKIDSLTHILMIAKNLERIGDKATNIAEHVHYSITGTPIAHLRPKHDLTSSFSKEII